MSLNIRIEKIQKHSGKNVTAFGSEFSSVGIENIRKMIKNPDVNPSYSFIVELLRKYPEINWKWLLFGEGEMLNKKIDTAGAGEVEQKYKMTKIDCQECISKQKEIDALKIALEAKEELLEMYRKRKDGEKSCG